MAFQPKDGKALWLKVLDLVIDMEPGTIVTFSDLEQALGYDPSKPGASRGPVRKASEHLLTERKRALRPERGIGYRVAEASEHEGMARGEQRSARRKLRHAVALTVNVDRNALTPAQRTSVDALAQVLAAQNSMLSRHDARIGQVEQGVQRVDERVSMMEAMLRRHGLDIPGVPETIEGEVVDDPRD